MRTNQPGRSTTPEEQDLMGYLVQAEDTGDEVCLTVENRKEALATAVGGAARDERRSRSIETAGSIPRG